MIDDLTSDRGVDSVRDRAQSYVVFRLGGEGYALEVLRVREVLDVLSITEVPGASRCLLGVINLRGHVVPVYDLRLPFGLAIDPRPARAPSVLIVENEAGDDSDVTGLLVDRVSDVLEFPPDQVQPSPRLGLGRTTPFVRGLIRHQEAFLLVLDLDRVFAALATINGEGI